MTNKHLIFDFGANQGQNIDYYLMKCDELICVEANPEMVKKIENKYWLQIQQKRLFVENCVLGSDNEHNKLVDFFIHKQNPLLSQKEKPTVPALFKKVKIRAKSLASLLDGYLTDNKTCIYMKFDLEGFDLMAIEMLFNYGLYPENISFEAHRKSVVDFVTNSGKYFGYKLIDGHDISLLQNLNISTKRGDKKLTFNGHSAGPFGRDLPGPYFSKKAIDFKLRLVGFGWKDIHATRIETNIDNNLVRIACKHFLLKFIVKIYKILVPISLRKQRSLAQISKKIYRFMIKNQY